jgi:hypothetical protein
MIDINKMIDLAEKHGFEVSKDSDKPGFFKKTHEGQVKFSADDLIEICLPRDITSTVANNFSWESQESLVVKHQVKIQTNLQSNYVLVTWEQRRDLYKVVA